MAGFHSCIAVALIGMLAGCEYESAQSDYSFDIQRSETAQVASTAVAHPVRLNSRYLPNLVQVHSRVLSGGLPDGDAAFRELADRGIRTIISVDAAKPDVESARRFGLRYVHLPHGYDGIPSDCARQLAKAVRDLDGPIYIHCHHGRHRSPAAASVACVSAGLVPSSQAISILKLAGTNPGYAGLFQSVKDAIPLEPALLDKLNVEFREVVEVPPMAEAMVKIGHTHDHLKLLFAAGRQGLKDHSDLHPAYEALLLREHFTELLRTQDVQSRSADFQQWLRDSEVAARGIEEALAMGGAEVGYGTTAAELVAQMDRIAANCKACHRQYRDVPLRK
jgi:protein tyrosine phosphatase (PTP) superfamily phosphohydrolase (DUF442 family)